MPRGFLNACGFRAVAGGTVDFEVDAALTDEGLVAPDDCTPAAVDGLTYRYVAHSDDFSEIERGDGVWDSGTQKSTRVPRSGSNGTSKVDFTDPPKVYYGGPLARDMHWEVIGDTTVSSPVASIEHAFDPSLYAQVKTVLMDLTHDDVVADDADWGLQLQQSDDSVDLDKTQMFTCSSGGASSSVTGTVESVFSTDRQILVPVMTMAAGTNIGSAETDTADISATTKIVYFFCGDATAGQVADATDTISGRIITYGLLLPT